MFLSSCCYKFTTLRHTCTHSTRTSHPHPHTEPHTTAATQQQPVYDELGGKKEGLHAYRLETNSWGEGRSLHVRPLLARPLETGCCKRSFFSVGVHVPDQVAAGGEAFVVLSEY
jgi:hypothetical protein